MQSSHKWSAKRKATITKALKRSWSKGGAHRERVTNQKADADTMRQRALWDRKGTPVADIYIAGELYTILHSHRRTDSYDVKAAGREVCSGGKAKVGLFLGSLLP